MQSLSLNDLRNQVRRYGCDVVTNQFLREIRKDQARYRDAERQLRDLAALRLVSERVDWRGRLARRWIKRTRKVLDLLKEQSV